MQPITIHSADGYNVVYNINTFWCEKYNMNKVSIGRRKLFMIERPVLVRHQSHVLSRPT